MMDSLSVSLLQDLIRREGRSLLQYVREAYPWATAAEHPALNTILEMIDEEQKATAALARVLIRHHQPLPYVGPYPMNFTDVNYVSLDHLVPMLVEHQKRSITHLQRDLALLRHSEAREQARKLLAAKEQHLQQLETLLAPKPKEAATAAT